MTETITTRAGDFTAEAAGDEAGVVVLLLHGFPQTRHAWRHQVPAVAREGWRAVAPDQRGYSPGVRPDPASDISAYHIDRLVEDVLDLAWAAGRDALAPFHLVGHDWGAQVAWTVAARHPDRVASLTVLSRPHPGAFLRSMEVDADGQRHRSRHHQAFQDPSTASLLLEDGGRRLRQVLREQGVPEPSISEYLSVLADPLALDAALAWYRAAGSLGAFEIGTVEVPTLYMWGDADATVGFDAAERTKDFVAGPYRFELLPGVGHFVTDQVPDTVSALLIEHLGRFRGGSTR